MTLITYLRQRIAQLQAEHPITVNGDAMRRQAIAELQHEIVRAEAA